MAIIPVELAGREYEVRVGHGLLQSIATEAEPFLRKRHVCIVADINARANWGDAVSRSLELAGIEPRWFDVAPGEASKSWDSLACLTDWLLAQNVERGDHVFALGGGVVGDLTGFACAILKRGCGFVQLPTTLLSQVDSSVGGKTAINTPAGKNLVGAFHQPSLVLADLGTLSTLPKREMRAGYAEVLKYGVLGDRSFFDWLEEHGDAVLGMEQAPLEEAVARSVSAKARIVAEDERETSGARALLNLGHTFGHALEAETGFSDKLLHGEAVAMGMVLGMAMGMGMAGMGMAVMVMAVGRSVDESSHYTTAATPRRAQSCEQRSATPRMTHLLEGSSLLRSKVEMKLSPVRSRVR